MNLQLHFFNFWPILATVLTNMLTGALWYSPVLFGKQWMVLINKSPEEISKEDGNKAMMLGLIPAIFTSVFLYLLLSICNATTLWDGLAIGMIASVGFASMTLLNHVIFEGRPFKLFLINAGYAIASMNIAAIIITLWQ